MSHKPKPPNSTELEWLLEMQVDTEKGKVYRDGEELGTRNSIDGYWVINVYRRSIRRSHIVWWAKTGGWPKLTIDHKDRVRTNDAFDNLIEATMQGQARNKGPRKERGIPSWVNELKR